MATLRKAWRWQPASHPQAWLVALATGAGSFGIASAIGGQLGVRAAVAATAMLSAGLSQSYRVGRPGRDHGIGR
jgi:NhaP-type Na+/H+ or K+/H+ antiporter